MWGSGSVGKCKHDLNMIERGNRRGKVWDVKRKKRSIANYLNFSKLHILIPDVGTK